MTPTCVSHIDLDIHTPFYKYQITDVDSPLFRLLKGLIFWTFARACICTCWHFKFCGLTCSQRYKLL